MTQISKNGSLSDGSLNQGASIIKDVKKEWSLFILN